MKKLIALLALAATPLIAAEGMWMPQQIPQLADELRRLGLKKLTPCPTKVMSPRLDPVGWSSPVGNGSVRLAMKCTPLSTVGTKSVLRRKPDWLTLRLWIPSRSKKMP